MQEISDPDVNSTSSSLPPSYSLSNPTIAPQGLKETTMTNTTIPLEGVVYSDFLSGKIGLLNDDGDLVSSKVTGNRAKLSSGSKGATMSIKAWAITMLLADVTPGSMLWDSDKGALFLISKSDDDYTVSDVSGTSIQRILILAESGASKIKVRRIVPITEFCGDENHLMLSLLSSGGAEETTSLAAMLPLLLLSNSGKQKLSVESVLPALLLSGKSLPDAMIPLLLAKGKKAK